MNKRFAKLAFLAIVSINIHADEVNSSSSASLEREPVGIIELKEGVKHWRPESPPFEGRQHAGHLLGEQLLKDYGINELKDAVVLGCPRGGVLFAQGIVDVIRKAGGDPMLDLIICRKIPIPGQDDYGVGAVTEQGTAIYIDALIERLSLDPQSDDMMRIVEKTREEVKRRIKAYRQDRPLLSLAGKVVIVVDGVVNGGTMIGCIESVREHSMGTMRRIIVATPVSSPRGKANVINLARIPEEDFCTAVVATPPLGVFWNSDDFYQQTKMFEQMTDQEVRDIIQAYRNE